MQKIEIVKYIIKTGIIVDNYIITGAKFGNVSIPNEKILKYINGDFKLDVKYYNKDYQEVDRPSESGRYGLVCDLIFNDCECYRYYKTLFKWPLQETKKRIQIINKIINNLISVDIKCVQNSDNKLLQLYGGAVWNNLINTHDIAVLLSSISHGNVKSDDIFTINNNWWIGLKRKLYKVDKLLPKVKIKVKSTYRECGQDCKIDRHCKKWGESARGVSVCVIKKNKLLYNRGYGKFQENQFTTRSLIKLNCMTDLFYCIAIMQLVETGLDLNAHIGKYLPMFDIRSKINLKVINLIKQIAYFSFALDVNEDYYFNDLNYENSMAMIHKCKEDMDINLNNISGTFEYGLAGRLIEYCTGKSITEYFNDNIIKPLGLLDTYAKNGYYNNVYTSAYDLLMIGKLIINDGIINGVEYLKKKYIKLMIPHLWDNGVDVDKQGLGLVCLNRPLLPLNNLGFGHIGDNSLLCIEPKRNMVITITGGLKKFKERKYHHHKRYTLVQHIFNKW